MCLKHRFLQQMEELTLPAAGRGGEPGTPASLPRPPEPLQKICLGNQTVSVFPGQVLKNKNANDSSVRPQTEVFLEIQKGGIWRHLEGIWKASGRIWKHLGASGKHLGASGRHLGASGGIWETSGSIWEHLEASGRHLEASGKHQEASGKHLEASGKHLGGI